MARARSPRQSAPPAAPEQPVVSPRLDGRRWVTIRAGHRHRGTTYDGRTRYEATADEVELLTRYNALVDF